MFVGMNFPVTLKPEVWMIILCFYTLLAAGIPVWIILQPGILPTLFYFTLALK
ncbi:MAG TPA: hypothetical protein DDY86_09790 [Syntrophaceae bacterium]|nr:hypothetical protein [Syntrophaceae bacterium]